MKIYTLEEVEKSKEDTVFVTITTNQKVRMHNGQLQVYSMFEDWIYCLPSNRWTLEGYKLLN